MADLGIANTELGGIVQDRMDMQRRSCRLAAELSQSLYELFLEVVGKRLAFVVTTDHIVRGENGYL